MSEDVKPKLYYVYKGTSNFCSELELDEKCESYVKSRPDGFYDVVSTKDTVEGGIAVIELEPTMRLMDEMYDVINSIENCYGDAMYGHGLTEALKKYKKFKGGLE